MPIVLPGEEKKSRKIVEKQLTQDCFPLPNVTNVPEYCSSHFSSHYDDQGQAIKFNKGTTTLAFIYQGGVIVSVDSRATQGPFIGMLIAIWLFRVPVSTIMMYE